MIVRMGMEENLAFEVLGNKLIAVKNKFIRPFDCQCPTRRKSLVASLSQIMIQPVKICLSRDV